jgi:hypothetical protein
MGGDVAVVFYEKVDKLLDSVPAQVRGAWADVATPICPSVGLLAAPGSCE